MRRQAIWQKEKNMTPVILILLLLLIPWMAGNGILYVIDRKEKGIRGGEALVVGWIGVIGAAEAVHLCAVFLHVSITVCAMVFGGIMAVVGMGSLAVCVFSLLRTKSPDRRRAGWRRTPLFWAAAAICLGQVLLIWFRGEVCLSRDMTLETVVSFLQTDGAYLVNPMTGTAYESGIPLRLEILCLPTLYSALCRLFAAEPGTLVWMVIPCVMVVCSYSSFYCVGKALFPRSAAQQDLFLVLTAVLLGVGSYALGMDGFGLFYSGWRGGTIRNAVLIPYLISLCLRRRWKTTLLCIAAEACLVWTLYGAGACMFVDLGMAACLFVWQKYGKSAGKERKK